MNVKQRLKAKPPQDLVEIVWGDAWGKTGWFDRDELLGKHTVLLVSSVGYLIEESAEGYTLAAGVSEYGAFLGVSFKPKGMVYKIRRLK